VFSAAAVIAWLGHEKHAVEFGIADKGPDPMPRLARSG
jgi:hypothetical protein